jgi:hypothetical protein
MRWRSKNGWVALAVMAASMAMANAAPGGPADIATPVGWVSQNDDDLEWLKTSSQGTNVMIAFDVAERSPLALQAWFQRKIADVTKNARVSGRAGISSEPGILKDAFLATQAGATMRVYAFAWDTPQGKQAAFVTSLSAVSTDDPVVQEGIDHVVRAWRRRAALSAGYRLSATTALAGQPAANPAQQTRAPSAANPPANQSASRGSGRCRDVTRLRTTMQTQMQCNAFNNTCAMVTVPVSSESTQTECD